MTDWYVIVHSLRNNIEIKHHIAFHIADVFTSLLQWTTQHLGPAPPRQNKKKESTQFPQKLVVRTLFNLSSTRSAVMRKLIFFQPN